MLVAVCFASAVSAHIPSLITGALCQVENLILPFICPALFDSLSKGCWQGKSAESSSFCFSLTESCGQMHSCLFDWVSSSSKKQAVLGKLGLNRKHAVVKGIVLFPLPKEMLKSFSPQSPGPCLAGYCCTSFFSLLTPFFTVVPGSAWSKRCFHSSGICFRLACKYDSKRRTFLLTAYMGKPVVFFWGLL